jgi:hypothetical protein
MLDAGKTYSVRAGFKGNCSWRDSSDIAYYTVVRSAVDVDAMVLSRRGARFLAIIDGAGGLRPRGGLAKFVVKRVNGKVVVGGSASVRDGRASVDLRDLRKGRYVVSVRFGGSSNFRGGDDRVAFRVR